MRAYLIIIFQVRQQYVTEVPLSEHNNVVKAFPSDRTDQPFGEAALKCRSCRTPRYSPPVHMIKLTRERGDRALRSGCIPMMIDEPRLTVSLPRMFRCWVCALAETAHRIPVRCNGGSDGHTNRDGSHRRYPAQFRCEERGRALEGRGALQGVDRRRLYRGGPYRVRRGGREAHV